MDAKTARTLMNEAAHLIELVATFQSRYGRSYNLQHNSPKDARALYDDILNAQHTIAALLDADTLQNPHHKLGQWWQRQEIIDLGMTQSLVNEAGHLISCCAYFEADPRGESYSYAIRSAQSTIAGMLHPKSLEYALTPRPVVALQAS